MPVLTYEKKKGQRTEISGNLKLGMVKARQEKKYKKGKAMCKASKAIKAQTLQVNYYYILCNSKAY